MSAPYVQCAPGVVLALNATATDEAQAVLLLGGKCARLTVYVIGTGTTSSGVIEIEEAYYDAEHGAPQYAGTWSTLQTINASTVTGGAQQAFHFDGSFWAVRVRISTVIGGGGTITAVAWGN